MFRIDRSFVNLAATRSVQVDNDGTEAGAVGNYYPDAAASAAQAQQAVAMAEDMLNNASIKAGRITEEARGEAAAILLSARDQAEEDRRSSWQEGFAEGTEQGKCSFDKQLAAKLREDDESLRRVIDELYEERTRTYNGLEGEVVALAMEIVKKVIDTSEESGSVFQALIINALKQLNPDKKVIIRVGPVDYERFFSSGKNVFELSSGVTVTASVLRDISLGEGDCVIDTEETTINAGLDSQFKYIKLAFDSVENKGLKTEILL